MDKATMKKHEPGEMMDLRLVGEALVEIVDPVTGEVKETNDELIGLAEFLGSIRHGADNIIRDIKRTLWKRTEDAGGTGRTRRIAGGLRTAKLEEAEPTWSQPMLREVLERFPGLANGLVVTASLRVDLREWKKVQGTASDDAAFQEMKKAIEAARLPPGTPSMKVEV